MARVSLTLLGGFHARSESAAPVSIPTRKAQALLAYLALPLGQAHPRDKLAALLWGDLRAEPARNNVRQTLFVLRKGLAAADPAALHLDDETVALNPVAVEVDVPVFERRVAEGTPDALAKATALYRGDLLAGLSLNESPFEEWLLGERERLRELALEALAKLLAHQRRAAPSAAAIQTAVRLLTLDPLQEVTHRVLIQLYAGMGRRDAALRQYQVCSDVLERELGVEPEAETKALYQEILRRRGGPTARPEAPARRAPAEQLPHPTLATLIAPSAEIPLIGREREVARLRAALEEAWGGRGRVVALLGQAGIGKSRLGAQLAQDALERGGRVLLGRAYENQEILTFGPWVDALRSGQVAREAAGPGGIAPVWRRELVRLLPELAGPEPQADAPEPLKLFESVAQVLEHLAVAQPLLLVLEDLQWADEMSLRLLGFLGRRLAGWPALVAVTAREEELTDAPLLGRIFQDLAREERLVPVTLTPLSQADTLSLVRALGRARSEAAGLARLEGEVWAASEGNPFLIVEAVRALRDGTTILTPAGLTLPERVRQVIARRLERLTDRSRQLITAAAVIAREFDFTLLQRASGLSEGDAAEGVEELVRRQILRGVGERFEFSHDAIRATVTQQILPPRARVLHRHVGEALESLHGEDLASSYAVLGRHFHEGEVWDKAVRYLRLAGAQALGRSAHREALASFERAREAVDHLPQGRERLAQAIDVRIDLYRALVPLGAPQQIAHHLQEAERFAETLDDPVRLGWVVAYATNSFWLAGDSDRALECGTRAAALADALDDVGLRVVASFYLAQVHYFRGEYPEAIGLLRRTVASLEGDRFRERFGLPGLPAVLARGWLAWSLAEVGEFAEGLTRGEEAVRLAEAVDHAFSRADAYRELGCLLLRKGDVPAALLVLDKGLALCRSRDLDLWVPSIGAALGYAYALSGRAAEATTLLESALEQATSLGIRAGQAIRSAWLGESYLRAGRGGDALRFAREAVDLARTHKERGHEAWALRLLGEVAAQGNSPEPETAVASYGQALALAGELGMRPLVAHCHRGLSLVYQRTDPDVAREHLRHASQLCGEMDMRFWPAPAPPATAK